MPRYFFHLHDDQHVEDEDGTELLDFSAAREHAQREAVHMAAASISEHKRLVGSRHIDVEDQAGEVLLSVFFRDVVGIEP